jgi:hypothetical protein
MYNKINYITHEFEIGVERYNYMFFKNLVIPDGLLDFSERLELLKFTNYTNLTITDMEAID